MDDRRENLDNIERDPLCGDSKWWKDFTKRREATDGSLTNTRTTTIYIQNFFFLNFYYFFLRNQSSTMEVLEC